MYSLSGMQNENTPREQLNIFFYIDVPAYMFLTTKT